jgi:hypothetical protein
MATYEVPVTFMVPVEGTSEDDALDKVSDLYASGELGKRFESGEYEPVIEHVRGS